MMMMGPRLDPNLSVMGRLAALCPDPNRTEPKAYAPPRPCAEKMRLYELVAEMAPGTFLASSDPHVAIHSTATDGPPLRLTEFMGPADLLRRLEEGRYEDL